MYRISMIALIAGVLFACQSTSPTGGISGTLSGIEGETIYLERYANQEVVRTDSATIGADGSFELQVSPALQLDYYRLTAGDTRFWVITDSTENLVINAQAENLGEASVTGSQNTMLLFDLNKQVDPIVENVLSIREKMKDPRTQAGERAKLNNEIKAEMQSLRSTCLNFIKDNSASPAILWACAKLDKVKDEKTYQKTLDAMKGVISHSFYYEAMETEFEAAKKAQQFQKQTAEGGISTGVMAPALSFPDPQGKTRSLEDLKGNVVLIDFWASWCRPCRAENPNVVRAYNKYKSKGFEIYSVSLDKDVNRWTAAIDQDGLVWPNHVSDLKGWQSAAASLYGVRSIPFTVLLDQEGKVAATNLRGPALEAKLAELLDT